jgi:hypothetical protein
MVPPGGTPTMTQAMMFRDKVRFRAVLQALSPHIKIQDDQRDQESAAGLLSRLDGDDSEDVRGIPELLVAGINRDGCLIFIKAHKEETKKGPVWFNLTVPPPDRFRIVPYDPPAISEQLAEHLDTP